jgi:quercetin dioxygenase-like cupin family protein
VPGEQPQPAFASEDVVTALSGIDWAAELPGIRARETHIGGRRWAIFEYAPGARRTEWCRDGHAGFMLSGRIDFEFEDGGPELIVNEGDAFALSLGRGHRGTNRASTASRMFLIDDPA